MDVGVRVGVRCVMRGSSCVCVRVFFCVFSDFFPSCLSVSITYHQLLIMNKPYILPSKRDVFSVCVITT